jgi:hypothetical protein
MKKLLVSVGAAVGCLALGAVTARAQGGTGAVMKEARVTQVVKDVKILSSQAEPRPATLSDTVRGDTAVRTGVESRAELTFADLTIARLGANTIFSFNEGSRTVDLGNGAILLHVPKGSGGAKIQTAAVTAAITGTTVIAEYHPKSYAKYLVLEGVMRIYLKGVLGESMLMHAGQMMILNPNAKRLSEVVDFDQDRLLKTSLFIQGFRPLPSVPLMAEVQHDQLEKKAAGELIDTNLVIFGRGTLVTLTDPQSTDVIDRKTAAVTLPIPTPTATATARPLPSPTPTATTPPSPTPTVTPPPTPNKFGTPPPIVTFVPYPIDSGTTIQTDPAITRGGVTDFGKIYRDAAQDGPFSTWAFTATSPFDNTVGIDMLYGGNVPVAAFKFTALQLVGNPTISTANGGALNLVLISVGPITTAAAGTATFTFAGMQSVLLATQNGSIDISSPDITFQNIPLLFFYARGAGSNLTLGGMGTFNVGTLRLMAENNIQINSPQSLSNGANGGTLFGIAGGGITVNSPIDTQTAPVNAGTFSGAGGTVSLTALGGTVSVGSRIQTSYDTPGAGIGPRSGNGGTIGISSGLTTGTGISLGSGASLLSLLNAAAPGPAGSITLTTAGSDIVTNGATLEADRGTITIQQTAAASAGTAQITLNGGTITSETLLVSSRGDLAFGGGSPVNLSTITLSLLASRNLTLNGVISTAAAGASSGNILIAAGGNLTIIAPTIIQRSNGGITDGLRIAFNGMLSIQAELLNLRTDGSGLTNGGDISLSSDGPITSSSIIALRTGPANGNQANGSNITINSGATISAGAMGAQVQIGAGRTLGNGGNITITGVNYSDPSGNGIVDLDIINSAPGVIGTGGNISLTLTGSLANGPNGLFNLTIDNSGGGRIQTGGNITATIGTGLTSNAVNVLIDNRFKGFIGTGAGITFSSGGTFMTKGNANFEILNSQLGSTGGTIVSDAFIKVTFANATIGADLNAFIDNSNGAIGGVGGTVTLQINGKLAVTGRIDVLGTLNATGSITAGTLSATNVNAPGIDVGAGGITRFTFPNEITVNPLHTITTNGLTSTGGINFNGPDIDTPPGFGPFDGGQLTINVPSLTFGPSAADNIKGPVTFNGGSTSTNAIPAGNGGTFTVNATGAITVSSPIEATTGLQPSSSEPSGAGGTVTLNSTGGTISVNSPITVSSAEAAAGTPRRHSRQGGNINLQSNSTGVAINISNTGQLLSLLEPAAAGPGGKITILATATGSRINVTGDPGSAGTPGVDTIRADKGTVDIRNTGANGAIFLNTVQISADIVKIGALGANGTLTIGGGRINADTLLQLYATGSNGSVIFVSNVLLSGNSMKIIAGNTVTVNNGVVVTVAAPVADIYVSDLNHANYSNFNGGNNSTDGSFRLQSNPSSPGATTHFGPPPPPPFGGGL